MPKPKPEKTLEEKIQEEARKLADRMGEKGIERQYGPLSECTSVQRAFSPAGHQIAAHGAFDRLAALFAEWAEKHPQ